MGLVVQRNVGHVIQDNIEWLKTPPNGNRSTEIVNIFQSIEPNGYDLVIAMLSSHNISRVIGKRLSNTFTAHHSFDFLRKRTIEEAYYSGLKTV